MSNEKVHEAVPINSMLPLFAVICKPINAADLSEVMEEAGLGLIRTQAAKRVVTATDKELFLRIQRVKATIGSNSDYEDYKDENQIKYL
ncbi:MAG TPA: hypothetical protein VK705_10130 [Ferruginibacter sp.]|jgi:hypothetical protein|nr:hypothetical protein [Ferruginibacter sp.]